MMNLARRIALAALLVATAIPAQAQTDDRVLNDVFTVLRGETLLTRTRELCLMFADIDLEADLLDWTGRNGDVLQRADGLLDTRPGLEDGMLDALRGDASGEADASFAREADKPAYCEGIGEAIAAGSLDFATWFPRETTRMAEAEAGRLPPLDLADAAPVADAIAVKQYGFRMNDILVRCGVLFPPDTEFEAARAEWEARNAYTIELADRVLDNWGALHPARWEAARDASGAEVDDLFAPSDALEPYCRATAAGVANGSADIDRNHPELFDSVLTNAEIIP